VVALLADRPELVEEVEAERQSTRLWIAKHLQEAFGSEDVRPLFQSFLPEVVRTPGLLEMVEEQLRTITEAGRRSGS